VLAIYWTCLNNEMPFSNDLIECVILITWLVLLYLSHSQSRCFKCKLILHYSINQCISRYKKNISFIFMAVFITSSKNNHYSMSCETNSLSLFQAYNVRFNTCKSWSIILCPISCYIYNENSGKVCYFKMNGHVFLLFLPEC
jgi:hypothetical protein